MDKHNKDVSSDLDWSNSNESLDSRRISRYLFPGLRNFTANEFVNTNFIDYDTAPLSPLNFQNDTLGEDDDVGTPSFSATLHNSCPPNSTQSQIVTTVDDVITAAAAAAATDLELNLKLEDSSFTTPPDSLDPTELFNKSLSPADLVNDIHQIETSSQNSLLSSETSEDLQANLMSSPSIDKALSMLETNCPHLLQSALMPPEMCPTMEDQAQLSQLGESVVQLNGSWPQENVDSGAPLPVAPLLSPQIQGRVQLVIASPDGTTMAYNLDGTFPAEQLVLLAATLKPEPSLVMDNTVSASTPPATPVLSAEEPSSSLPELPLDAATNLDCMQATLGVDGSPLVIEGDFLTLNLDNSTDYSTFLIANNNEKVDEISELLTNNDNITTRNIISEEENVSARNIISEDENISTRNISEETNPAENDKEVQRISDKFVPPRAWATLPASYLAINTLPGTFIHGVFARKSIPKRTQFGPVEGIRVVSKKILSTFDKNNPELKLFVEEETGQFVQIDISNHHFSNWMRFVRPAKTSREQNLTLTQQGYSLYFTTTRQVFPRQELRVWYSSSYADRRGLQLLSSNSDEKASQEVNEWPCFECNEKYSSSNELQKHLNIHEAERKHTMIHGEEEQKPFQCSVCLKRFLNNSALSCHIKVHKDKNTYTCPLCNKVYQQVLQFKEHIAEHCVNGRYPCNQCDRKFDEYSAVRKHILSFHCDRKHFCDFCLNSFPTLDKLRMHMLKHSDHREFLCADCGKQFKRKDKLKEHMRRGHSENQYKQLNNSSKSALVQQNLPSAGSTGLEKLNLKNQRKSTPKLNDYQQFIYKCHLCVLGFKRRGMLVNHLAKQHPTIKPESVPELNLPILKTTREYFCQYCEKVYKSSSKRKAHILKIHPGAELPLSNRSKGVSDLAGMPNPSFSQPVGSVPSTAHSCNWCHKQYASKAKLLQHNRSKHQNFLQSDQQVPRTSQSEPQMDALSLQEAINFLPVDPSGAYSLSKIENL